ncbi:hypothetical protein EDB84DRAFT_1279429, partial [Lactarius hengduanensis]
FSALKLATPTYGDLNHFISIVTSGLTICLHFPGQLNSDLRKLAVNMVPSRLHFFLTGLVPLTTWGTQQYRHSSRAHSANVRHQEHDGCLRSSSWSLPDGGRCLPWQGVNERGEEQMQNSAYIVEWIPNNVLTVRCDGHHLWPSSGRMWLAARMGEYP